MPHACRYGKAHERDAPGDIDDFWTMLWEVWDRRRRVVGRLVIRGSRGRLEVFRKWLGDVTGKIVHIIRVLDSLVENTVPSIPASVVIDLKELFSCRLEADAGRCRVAEGAVSSVGWRDREGRKRVVASILAVLLVRVWIRRGILRCALCRMLGRRGGI